MKKHLKKVEPKSAPKKAFKKPDIPSYDSRWQQAGLTRHDNEFGIYYTRKVQYPKHYKHGDLLLSDFFTALASWQQLPQQHPLYIAPNEQVIFFDTETTGLKGVGTQIFLLGLLEANEEGFLLTQYVLAGPAHEAALFFAMPFWRQPATIVSYNGKSFDWPQLITRWTLQREWLPPLKDCKQVDLLHSTRRIWKEDLSQMKLTTIEQQKLGFTRQGDIPGFLAPIIYLDAVKSGEPSAVMKVLQHNEWDLLSLITLYAHSTKLLLQYTQEESPKTVTNIGKWYADLKELAPSQAFLTEVTTKYSDAKAHEAQFLLAQQYKRAGDYAKAITAFTASLPTLNEVAKLQAYEQLAILYEHKMKTPQEALPLCDAAQQILRASIRLTDEQKARRLQNWAKRSERLQRKIQNDYN